MRLAAAVLALALIAPPALAQDSGPAPKTPTSQAARDAAFATLPYWPGYWVSEYTAGTTIGGLPPAVLEARENGTKAPTFQSLNGFSAPWNEEGKKRWADLRARSAGLKATGWGFPMMMDAATPIQVLITPEEVLIINGYNEARHVYMDRPMPKTGDLWPTVYGTSVGHWDGDTLVIDTIMVDNPASYFHGAPPLSEDARYEERMHLDGDRLVSDVTITDPKTLSKPWTAQVSWLRDKGFDRMIQIDWNNDRTGVENGVNTIEDKAVQQ